MTNYNQKWFPDSNYCPNGHLRELCEQVYTDSTTSVVRRICKIRKRERDQASEIKKRNDPDNISAQNTSGYNAVTITLVCGHFHLQPSRMFSIREEMFCRVHQEWFSIHCVTQFGVTSEVTPLLSRCELYDCTTKTGHTSRCKNAEAPPFTPAIISQNNKGGHSPTYYRGVIKAQKVG